MIKRNLALSAVAGVAAALLLAACSSSSNPVSSGSTPAAGGSSTAPAGAGESITVGSANFSESEILADVYAAALKAKGVKVTMKPNIGSRQVYIPALQDGSIDLIPEYSGTLLEYFNKTATQTSSADVYSALQTTVPSGLTVLTQASAQDSDQIVVTTATATKYNLKSIADLKPVAGSLTMGAAPEFATVADGIPALKSVYGVVFGTFKPLDAGGPLTVNALKNGQIDAGDIFSTFPDMAADGFVALQDPKGEFAAQNLLPLISTAKATPTVTAALNAVSAKLDQDALNQLDVKASASNADLTSIAQAWLTSVGLG
jgi:osmoprotectant transport system substrate-binding protein